MDITSFILGYKKGKAVGGEGTSTETVIMAENTQATVFLDVYRVFGFVIPFGSELPEFPLALGDECVVVWDGIEYNVTTGDSSAFMAGTKYVGNGAAFGLAGNNEPFVIAWDSTGATFVSFTDTAPTSHTVTIYQKIPCYPATHPIHTVTFMSEDGETVLYQRSVVDGDNCADMVARGLLATPKKESSAQYNYTYSGWSPTSGGAASSSALSAVTGDRTVYAAFTASTRYYTVRFYDGNTLLKTASVAYGGSYTYTYTKEGYLFEGWNPEPTNVTSDMDCYGVWVEKPNFANSSWADIARICESGKAAETFALGDTRSIKLTMPKGSLWVQFQIVGFNHDDLADGSGKAGISVISVPTMYRTKLYEYDTNIGTEMFNDVCFKRGCWDTSALRTLCGTYIYSYLPSDLQACIKEVTKKFYNASRELSEIGDKVWIPSAYEITEPTGYTCGADGTRYAYFDTAVKRAKKKLDGTAAGYGTRSPSTNNNGFNAGINQGGAFYAQSAFNGYCPVGFCI